jgi:superoxide reductase
MEAKHYIDFVFVATKNGGQKKVFKPGDEPVAKFAFVDDEPVAVFAYCNIHGLWVYQL